MKTKTSPPDSAPKDEVASPPRPTRIVARRTGIVAGRAVRRGKPVNMPKQDILAAIDRGDVEEVP